MWPMWARALDGAPAFRGRQRLWLAWHVPGAGAGQLVQDFSLAVNELAEPLEGLELIRGHGPQLHRGEVFLQLRER
jgi:hypothetical protein